MPGGGRGVIEAPFADTAEPLSMDIDFWARVRLHNGHAGFAATPISVTVGPARHFELWLSTSIGSPTAPGHIAINPVVLGLKYRFVDETEVTPGVAARGALMRADRSADLRAELVTQKTLSGHFKLAGMLGYDLALFNGAAQRRQLRYAAALEYSLRDWSLGAELTGALDERHGYTGGQLGFGQRLDYRLGWGFELSALARVVPLADEPRAELMFGFLWSGTPGVDRDRDSDGVRDIDDRCVFVPEDKNDWQDDDGCPEGGPPEGVAGATLPLAYRFSTPTPRFRMRIPLLRLPGSLDTEATGDGEHRVRIRPGAMATAEPPRVTPAPGASEVEPASQPSATTQPASRPGTEQPVQAGTQGPESQGAEDQAPSSAPAADEVEVVVQLEEGKQVAVDKDRKARVISNPEWRRALQPVIPKAYVRAKSDRELQPWERVPLPDKPYVPPVVLDPGQEDNVLQVPASVDTVTFDKSLWTIAASPEGYGNAKLWPILYLANLDLVEAKRRPLKPPTLLVPRDLKVDPDRVVADFYEMRRRQQESLVLVSKARRTITLTSGQSLRALAERQGIYGDARFWTLLYAANLDRIDDPDKVKPGTVLRVPR